MSKLRILSAKELISAFLTLGFSLHSQRGSHVKLRRISNGRKQILMIPNHSTVAKGTLLSIYRQACQYCNEDDLRTIFFVS